MKILALVKFNQGVAYVVDEIPERLHEKVDIGWQRLMYGTDADGVLYRCYQYDSPSDRFKAFGGWEFDLKMRDGGVTHCNGQWWDAGASVIAKHLGIELDSITIQEIGALKQCYVFTGMHADAAKFGALVNAYKAENPEHKVYGYYEFEKVLKEATQ